MFIRQHYPCSIIKAVEAELPNLWPDLVEEVPFYDSMVRRLVDLPHVSWYYTEHCNVHDREKMIERLKIGMLVGRTIFGPQVLTELLTRGGTSTTLMSLSMIEVVNASPGELADFQMAMLPKIILAQAYNKTPTDLLIHSAVMVECLSIPEDMKDELEEAILEHLEELPEVVFH